MPTASMTAQRFRQRARKCREVAEEVQEPDWLNFLLELANDLEEEADRIEAEERGG